jgi:hypothetical protein
LNQGTATESERARYQPRHRQMMQPVGFTLLAQKRSQLSMNFDLNHAVWPLNGMTFIVAQTSDDPVESGG